jgi:N-hydroxyarylamine O-acetyltransferase
VRLELDGVSWLADVGVGSLSMTSAIRLEVGGEQATPHEPRRILHEAGRYFHQARLGDEWHDVCEFTLEEMPPIDRELANWYTSAHPGSHFKNRLLAARALPDGGRITLLNRELTTRQRNGTSIVRELRSPDEVLLALAEHFGLILDDRSQFASAAARLGLFSAASGS